MKWTWILAALLGTSAGATDDDPLHFPDPAAAIPVVTRLLQSRDWVTLGRYYHLDGSGVDREELRSGRFFYTEQRPAAAHPAGFWRYRHPFAPGFRYQSMRELPDCPGGAAVEVTVVIEIEQGGGPSQLGMQTFLMRRLRDGYQLLPGKAPAR